MNTNTPSVRPRGVPIEHLFFVCPINKYYHLRIDHIDHFDLVMENQKLGHTDGFVKV
jgi:hypothetical protein